MTGELVICVIGLICLLWLLTGRNSNVLLEESKNHRLSKCCNSRIIFNNGAKKNIQVRTEVCSKCKKDCRRPTSDFLPPPPSRPNTTSSIKNFKR